MLSRWLAASSVFNRPALEREIFSVREQGVLLHGSRPQGSISTALTLSQPENLTNSPTRSGEDPQ